MQKKSLLCLLIILFGGNTLLALAQLPQEDTIEENDSVISDKYGRLAWKTTRSNPALAKTYALKAIKHAQLSNNPLMESKANNIMGLCLKNLNQYDSSILYFQKAAGNSTQAKDRKGYGLAMNNMAMAYFYKGEYEVANKMLHQVIKQAEEHKIYYVMANAYQNLGMLYNAQERHKDALESFSQAEKYHKTIGDIKGRTGSANNMAYIYFKHLKQYNKAIAIYNEIIPLKQKIDDEKGIAVCYNNLAEIYLQKSNFELAIKNAETSAKMNDAMDDKHGKSVSTGILAEIYFKQKKYVLAEKYAQLSVDLAKEINAKKEMSDGLKLLAKIQGENKDAVNAYTNLLNSVKIKDSLLNKENFARMAELETKYETEKKERQILAQRTKIAENQLKLDRQNIIILGASLIAIIAVLIGFIVYNRQKLKTIKLEKEAELKDALQFIETQSKLQEQRHTISRDLHDNIGSQLTFIISSLDNLKYGFSIADEKLKEKLSTIKDFTKETITELRDTIWAMNKEQITIGDLNTRISNFIENAKAASKGIAFSFKTAGNIPDTAFFSSLKGINIYRVIQETVNNALKHSEATKIDVAFYYNNELYTIVIKDNGKGFNHEPDTTGNGLINIKKRIADCNGELTIVSANSIGTEITIHIK